MRGEWVDCLIALGSNVGDRLSHLKKACAEINCIPNTRVLKKSRVYETEPLGPSRRPFFNQALKIKTRKSPMGLLIELKRIEALAGRKPGKRWGPRSLDIDIITYGDQKIKTPWLTVPHPEATKRSFVLVPLLEIAPNARIHGGLTVLRALSRLKDISGTVKVIQ